MVMSDAVRRRPDLARLTEKQRILAAEVSDLLADAEAVDREEGTRFRADKRGDERPSELAERKSRLAKAAARKQLEDDAAARARKEAERKARGRGGRRTRSSCRFGIFKPPNSRWSHPT